jgi:hypothetical protein
MAVPEPDESPRGGAVLLRNLNAELPVNIAVKQAA